MLLFSTAAGMERSPGAARKTRNLRFLPGSSALTDISVACSSLLEQCNSLGAERRHARETICAHTRCCRRADCDWSDRRCPSGPAATSARMCRGNRYSSGDDGVGAGARQQGGDVQPALRPGAIAESGDRSDWGDRAIDGPPGRSDIAETVRGRVRRRLLPSDHAAALRHRLADARREAAPPDRPVSTLEGRAPAHTRRLGPIESGAPLGPPRGREHPAPVT